jgi:3-mercaptopyruvate sulfurtransferase SseA
MDEHTSVRVTRELRKAGWTGARALVGGWKAWLEKGMPVEETAERRTGGQAVG